MIARIRRALVFLFVTPPETFRREPAPRPRHAHPEPPARSAAADPLLREQLRRRGYTLIHYHRADPGMACTCETPDPSTFVAAVRDTPDGQL